MSEQIVSTREHVCGNCRYLDFSNPQTPLCRRYPAQLVSVRVDRNNPQDNGVRAMYPIKNPVLDWCGEHPEEARLRARSNALACRQDTP